MLLYLRQYKYSFDNIYYLKHSVNISAPYLRLAIDAGQAHIIHRPLNHQRYQPPGADVLIQQPRRRLTANI